jgi:hypothetical protein
MRALLCSCGQHLKADDKEALLREVREHLKREERPREHPLGRFLEEEQVRRLVAARSTTEGGMRAAVLGRRIGQ